MPLIIEHGERTVFDAGLAALGYPGTWATHNFECGRMKRHLSKGDYS